MGKGRRMPGNMNSMLKQVQQMQKKVEEAQAELETKIFSATVGGGAVKVDINGKKEIIDITLSDEIMQDNDKEMLQDLLILGVNEAIRKAEDASNNAMGGIAGGMNLPF